MLTSERIQRYGTRNAIAWSPWWPPSFSPRLAFRRRDRFTRLELGQFGLDFGDPSLKCFFLFQQLGDLFETNGCELRQIHVAAT